MKNNVIISLLMKDLKLFFKDKFFLFITVLGLIFYIALFFVMPTTVNDKISIGIFSSGNLERAFVTLEREDVNIIKANSIDEAKKLVLDRRVIASFYFKNDVNSNNKTIEIDIYTLGDVEPEMKEALVYIAKEMVYTQLGYGFKIESKNEIIGVDLAGKQISPAKKVIPVFAFLIILTETLGIANLIADEIERKTIYALLVTRAKISDIFIAKGIAGLLTTLIPSLLFIITTQRFVNFYPIFIILLVGSLFSIAVGFLVGSIGRDMMSVISWGAFIMIVLLLPAFNVMAPSSFTSWVKLIPTYHFVIPLNKVINFGESLNNLIPSILILLLSSVFVFLLSFLLLRRRIYES